MHPTLVALLFVILLFAALSAAEARAPAVGGSATPLLGRRVATFFG